MLNVPLTFAVVEKERKLAERNAKYAAKKAKAADTAATAATSKTKEKKSKQDASKDEPLPDYVEETPPGQKKSTSSHETGSLVLLD